MTKAATKPAAVVPAKAAGAAVKPAVDTVKPAADADAVWVRAKPGVARRCRAGLVFTSTPVLLPVDDLTQDQLDAIEADPLLEAVDAPVADAANETAE